ncbi:ion transporter [Lysobacter niastensis]|uniref:Ion transporter n=1 Tax=Lysobacter niastensis TaxID=380629 RepID=A0ABS0B5P7_9GAMM|nr:ion transporter [Lysobacter niastensis]MBF6024221.1 ion transporter [Lysobacter niastensis]
MRLQADPTLEPASETGWRRTWFDIIYRHDTRRARNFDLLLIFAILASVLVIMLDSVASIHTRHARLLYSMEWAFTLLFSIEYAMRLAVVRNPLRYALSLWGLIDLFSILPTYLSLLVPGSQSLLVVRVLRMLRLFRVLKLTRYVEESGVLMGALVRSRRKILLFLSALVTIAVVFGALMYVVEGPHHGFTDIPTSIYWAIVTMATVGFGDIAPQSALGRFVTSVLILIGYSIIAVPTGIYTAELASSLRGGPDAGQADPRLCTACGLQGHDPLAAYCRQCGQALPPAPGST